MKDSKIERIIEIFSHYSLEQRLAICRHLSYCATAPFGGYSRLIDNAPNNLFPWRVETLITIILISLNIKNEPTRYFPSDEYDKDVSESLHILEKNEIPPFSDECKEIYSPYHLLGPLFIKQISYQRYIYTKLYRFNYIFNYDEKMKSFFKKKTGISDFFTYAFLAEVPVAIIERYMNKTNIVDFIKYQSFIDYVVGFYSDSIKPLICDLSILEEKQGNNCNVSNLSELSFGYKCICERPIIKIDNAAFPIAAHCLDFACTEGLLLNITTSEKKIIDHIGPILEKYLYHLLEESCLYELPMPEKRLNHYFCNGDKQPADAIAKAGDTIVIFECKEKIYKRRICINDPDALSTEYEYVVSAVKQLLDYYKHLKCGAYNPFNCPTDKNKEVFLVLTKLFYIPINIEVVIRNVVKDEEYKEYEELLKTHLLVTDIDAIELFLLHGKDFVGALKQASLNKEMTSFAKYRPTCDSSDRSVSFKRFMDKLKSSENEHILLAASKKVSQ